MISLNRLVYFSVLAFPIVLLAVKPIAIVIYVAIVLMGFYVSISRKLNPFMIKKTKLFSYLTIGYFVVMALSVVLSSEPTNDWMHLSRIAYFLFAPFVAVVLNDAKVPIEKMIFSFKIGIIVAGLIVLGEYLFLDATGRLSGTYNPNTFGDIAVIMLYVSLALVSQESKQMYWLSLVSLFFGVTAVVQSGSRGSMLALLLLLPIFIWVKYRSRYHISVYRIWIVAGVLSLSLFANIIFTQASAKRIVNIANEIQISNSSSGIRIEMYSAGWKAFLDSPLFGYGYRNSNKVASKYVQDAKISKRISGYSHLHNEFLTHMVNAGILGLLSYFIVILLPVYGFLRSKNVSTYSYVGIMLCLGYFFLGLTHGMFGYEHEGALFVLLLGYAFTSQHYSLK